ncbi:M23 family metallopeptidase [uncultured Desulfovibrio sp.]|uniref:M23 family metallopeptidase n=1 Tax=uncultured Desulfovibrio sp. TaxID=167968 RepID=UPI0003A3BD38|nr:M23 family metallopeptidase [uncultured Desulfovibrio sp.]
MRKLLWLVEIFLIFLVGGVLVQHAGRTGFASAGPDAIIQLALPQAFSVPCEAGRAPEAVAVEDPAGASLSQSVPGTPTDAPSEVFGDSALQPALTPDTPLAVPPVQSFTTAGTEEETNGTASGEEVVKGTVEKGDTISKILEGTGSEGIYQYISAARQVFSMRSFREGQPYAIVTDTASGRVKRFEYEIDNRRRLVVEGVEEPAARVEVIEYVTLLGTVEAAISDNLFQAVADVGESPQMALQLAELFGAEINFIRDLQEGDSFSVLVEKRYREGEYKGYGRILAAHFTNKGKTFEAYLFRDGPERAQYYNRKGENLRKTLLQAPLAFTRVTSRFASSRKHPILGYSRPHMGVDYGAPTGTPVKAVGEGTVTKRGWAGGYGNQIIVRHVAGLESMYSHLSGYARGLRQGQRVRQGQVIGFVGSTGLATGPHLDFRLRQNGNFINPTKAINPRGAPVSARRRAAFVKTVAEELAYLQGRRPLAGYTVDSVVPEHSVLTDNTPDKKQKKSPPAKHGSGAR